MSRTTHPIILTMEERKTLDVWARGRNLPHRQVVRAKIITMAADGAFNQDIAGILGVSRPTVQLWRERFLALRLAGIKQDAPRPGRKPALSAKKVGAVVEATLHTIPANATHWSTRRMAQAQGLSQSSVQRHPRFYLHFTPTSSSWLNLVERWFREITDKRIRRSVFRSVPDLIAAINAYLDHHNQNPRVFVWSAPVERTMAKIAKCKEALDSLH